MDAMRPEGRGPAAGLLPPARPDPVPIEYPILAAWAALVRAAIETARYLAAPFGSYTALTVADTALGATVIKGNRVRRWAEVDLLPGTVRDGLIVDSDAFAGRMAVLIEALEPGRKLKDRRVALALTGRNMVHGRFAVYAPEDGELRAPVLEAARERLGVRVDELEIDWHATPLPEDGEEPDEAAGAEDPDAEEEPDPTHDVYAVGLYRNVIEANLRQITRLGARVVDLQPKALALAAVVDEPAAIVVDIEPQSASVVVVTDGLPEVVRNIALDSGLPAERAAAAIRDELERSVGYHDSLYPDDPLSEETPLFVTGQGEAGSPVEADLDGLAFERRELPRTLRAPAGFPAARFAAGVGVGCMARTKPWWLGAGRIAARPRLRFLPPAYRPRQMPVRLVLAGATAALLILGLGGLYSAVTDRMAAVQEQQHVADVLEQRVRARAAELRSVAHAQAGIEDVSAQAQTALRTANAIRYLDQGFATTLTEVMGHRVDGLVLHEVDDDGGLVTVQAAAAAYEAILDYVRALENSGAFDAVAIRTIGNAHSGAAPPGTGPPVETGCLQLSVTLELLRSASRIGGGSAQGEPSGARVHVPASAR